jgi:dTDP-4-amino-4,6-dideoxygalactose transaminase
MAHIPFNRSSILGGELEYIFQTITAGQIAGNQIFSHKCHSLLESLLGVRRALVTTSCTHALEMAALLLSLKPGDEVIVPSFTFVSTINAFVLRGAVPVFVDIRADTLNLDEAKIEPLITTRTRAIVPVHYAGVGCEMDTILELATKHGLPVIEDNAHGLFGKYKGRWLGTMGCLGTQSFHETKNFTCGEGGALLINDDRYIERAEIIREKGTNRACFFRGQVDKYSWVDVGSSYVMSDILAAFLFAQLEKWMDVQTGRQKIWENYHQGLRVWCQNRGVRQPFVPGHCEPAWHMYYLVMPSLSARTDLIAHLQKQGISAVFHYQPLHTSTMGLRFGGGHSDCPVTEEISDRLLRLPFYNSMTEQEQSLVIDSVCSFQT